MGNYKIHILLKMAFTKLISLLVILCVLGSTFIVDARPTGGKKKVIKKTIKKTTVRRTVSSGGGGGTTIVVNSGPNCSQPHYPVGINVNYRPYIGPVVSVNPFMLSNKPPTRPQSCNAL